MEVMRQNILKFKKDDREDDTVSASLLILCLEIVFILIKANKTVKRINIFVHTYYLYSAYADGTTFFLRDKRCIKELINAFSAFSTYSALKLNYKKPKIASIRVLKNVKVAVFGMKCINFSNDTVKITGIHFSYNKESTTSYHKSMMQ